MTDLSAATIDARGEQVVNETISSADTLISFTVDGAFNVNFRKDATFNGDLVIYRKRQDQDDTRWSLIRKVSNADIGGNLESIYDLMPGKHKLAVGTDSSYTLGSIEIDIYSDRFQLTNV